MKIVHLQAGASKTVKAIDEANRTGAYLVVRDRKTARDIGHLCKRFPLTYHELIQYRTIGMPVKNIVIDDG